MTLAIVGHSTRQLVSIVSSPEKLYCFNLLIARLNLLNFGSLACYFNVTFFLLSLHQHRETSYSVNFILTQN